MTIYDSSGNKIIDAPITKEAIIKYVLMGDYYVELSFNLQTAVEFTPGCYIFYRGRRFEIMSPVRPDFDTKTGGYKYVLQFQAQQNHMKRFICFWLGGPNPEAVFHNTTDLASFGALIVANMNKALGTKSWKMGTINNVEHPEATKLVSFNGDTCWDSLNTIAETFETEWWTEENNGIISLHFGKLEFGSPEVFQRGNVVQSIPAKKGNDAEYGTRFYVFGSTRNLTKEYGQSEQGGATNHVSEIRLRLPNGQQYINAKPNLSEDEIVEKVVFFDDIYPKNTETISIVRSSESEVVEGQKDPIFNIVSLDTPFRPTDIIQNEKLGAHFTSGSLTGREFELGIGNVDTWKPQYGFDIIPEVETSGDSTLIIPNASLKPEPGDTFVLTGVNLPQRRIEEAEQELLTAGTSYAIQHSSDTDVYDCPTNPVYCTLHDKNYEAGQAVLLMGPQFGVEGRLSRIQGYEKKLYNEYIATYTIGDNTPYSRLGSIEADAKAALYSQRIGVTETGAQIHLISRYDTTQPTDSNAYSARRAMWEFANKQTADSFQGKMTFKDGAQYGHYAPGITGSGGLIDKKGAAELESLILRRFLEVPELRYNRIEITRGDTWYAPSAGVIQDVDTENQIITLKLEKGEIGSPRPGDICMGIFHSLVPSENATQDYDDSRGNRRFAGFATCYFQVGEILDTTHYSRFKYQLRPISTNYPAQFSPTVSMNFVGYGSFTDPTRRTSRYETRTYQRYLKGVDNWEFTVSNIAAQFGDLTNLSVHGMSMKGYSAYLENVYMQGMLRSTDGAFVLDTQTKSLLMTSSRTGMGIAFNPEAGWMTGKNYNPETGRFIQEYDIEKIDAGLNDLEETVDNIRIGGVNLQDNSDFTQGLRQWAVGSAAYTLAASEADRLLTVTASKPGNVNLDDRVVGTLPVAFAEADYVISMEVWCAAGTAQLTTRIFGTDQASNVTHDLSTAPRRIVSHHKGGSSYQQWCFAFSTPGTYYIREVKVEAGNKATGWTPSPADVQARIEVSRQAAQQAQSAADTARQGVERLKDFSDTAFADGVVDRAEAASIEKYTNTVSETRRAADAAYATVYADKLLQGAARSNLQAAKQAFDTAADSLVEAIRTASADAVATPTEKAQVDRAFALFNAAYSTFTTRLEEAATSINTVIHTTAQGAYQLSAQLQATVDTLHSVIIPDLQAQIDGSIMSWEGEAMPTLTNYPASDWTSDAERRRHLGDYYDRYLSAQGERVTERYKFSNLEGVYAWVRVADSGAAQALSAAREALGLAGTKVRMVYGDALPDVPYAVNDIWINTTGEIRISNAHKQDGETAQASDWMLVNDAQVRLRQMASDRVVSKEEKAALRNTLAQYEQECAAYASDAERYGVSMADLRQAYEALRNFLAGTVAVDAATDTALTDAQHAAYNSHFARYDAEVGRFQHRMADALAQKRVDDLRIGGVNLQDNSDFTQGLRQWAVGSAAYTLAASEADRLLTVTASKPGNVNLDDRVVGTLPVAFAEADYVISMEVWCAAGTAQLTTRIFGTDQASNVTHDLSTAPRRIVSHHKGGSSYQQWCFAFSTPGTYYIREVKVEAGNKATGWTLSPADVQGKIDYVTVGVNTLDYLKNAFGQDTTTNYYGLTLGSFLGVKDSEDNVMAFLTGKDFSHLPPSNFTDNTSCPIFATGVPITNEPLIDRANKASFRVYPAGDVYVNKLIAEGACELRAGCKVGIFTIAEGLIGMHYSSGTHQVTLGSDRLFIAEYGADCGGYTYAGWWAERVEEDIVGLHVSSRSGSGPDQSYGAVKLTVADGHCALGIENGVIKGLRPQVRSPFSDTKLTQYDHTLLCNNPPQGLKLTLPAKPCTGQQYEIYKLNSHSAVRIYANGNPIYYLNSANQTVSTASYYTIETHYSMVKLIFMGRWYLFK